MKYKKLIAAGILSVFASSASYAEGELNLFNWGNYTSPELLEKFTKETGIKVTVGDYDTNEAMLAKVQAGGHGYDLAVPSDYMVKIMIDEGLILGFIAKLDRKKLGIIIQAIITLKLNFSKVDPLYKKLLTFNEVEYSYRVTGEDCIIMKVNFDLQ